MMRRTALLSLVLALCSVAPQLHAARLINARKPAQAGGSVEISNVAGDVDVKSWDRDEVHVTGELGRGSELQFESDGPRAHVTVTSREKDVDPTDLLVRVPRGSEVVVRVTACDVAVTADSPKVSVASVSGDVWLAGEMPDVSVEVVSGDVHVKGELRRVRIEAVSGDLLVGGELDGKCDMKLETVSGDIHFLLPRTVAADFELSTFSGEVGNGLTRHRARSSQFEVGDSLSFTVGKDPGRITGRSFSGDVILAPFDED